MQPPISVAALTRVLSSAGQHRKPVTLHVRDTTGVPAGEAVGHFSQGSGGFRCHAPNVTELLALIAAHPQLPEPHHTNASHAPTGLPTSPGEWTAAAVGLTLALRNFPVTFVVYDPWFQDGAHFHLQAAHTRHQAHSLRSLLARTHTT